MSSTRMQVSTRSRDIRYVMDMCTALGSKRGVALTPTLSHEGSPLAKPCPALGEGDRFVE